jgi:hypothetical protein
MDILSSDAIIVTFLNFQASFITRGKWRVRKSYLIDSRRMDLLILCVEGSGLYDHDGKGYENIFMNPQYLSK